MSGIIPPLTPYVFPAKPVAQITPFTYRDGLTFLEKFEHFRKYVETDIVGFINTNFADLADDFETAVNTIMTNVEAALTAEQTLVSNEIAENHTWVTQQIDDFQTILNTAVDGINNALTDYYNKTQSDSRYEQKTNLDADTKTLVNTVDSQLRVLLDSLYVNEVDATTDGSIAALINNDESATRIALDALYEGEGGGGEGGLDDAGVAALVNDDTTPSATRTALDALYSSEGTETPDLTPYQTKADLDTDVAALVNDETPSATRTAIESLIGEGGGGGTDPNILAVPVSEYKVHPINDENQGWSPNEADPNYYALANGDVYFLPGVNFDVTIDGTGTTTATYDFGNGNETITDGEIVWVDINGVYHHAAYSPDMRFGYDLSNLVGGGGGGGGGTDDGAIAALIEDDSTPSATRAALDGIYAHIGTETDGGGGGETVSNSIALLTVFAINNSSSDHINFGTVLNGVNASPLTPAENIQDSGASLYLNPGYHLITLEGLFDLSSIDSDAYIDHDSGGAIQAIISPADSGGCTFGSGGNTIESNFWANAERGAMTAYDSDGSPAGNITVIDYQKGVYRIKQVVNVTAAGKARFDIQYKVPYGISWNSNIAGSGSIEIIRIH